MDLAPFGQWWFTVKHGNSFRLECCLASEGSVLAAACLASAPRDYSLLSGVRGSAAQRFTESLLNMAGVTFLILYSASFILSSLGRQILNYILSINFFGLRMCI